MLTLSEAKTHPVSSGNARRSRATRVAGWLTVAALAAGVPATAGASPPTETQRPKGTSSPEPAPAEVADETPGDAQAASDAAAEAMQAGDYKRALEEYQRARSLDPDLDVSEQLAQANFQVGMEAYSAGQYAPALERFQDAQGLYPSPNFHYNIAQCYEALERSQQAIDSYRAFLRAVPDSTDKANIENKIARLERRIENDATRGGEPAPAEPTPTPIESPPEDTGPKNPGKALIGAGGVFAGLGLAVAIGGGLGYGAVALRRSDDVATVFEDGNPDGLTFDEAQQLDSEGKRAQTNQIISVVVGGTVAAVGVALLAVGLAKKKRAGNLEVAPTAQRGGAGLLLQGRF